MGILCAGRQHQPDAAITGNLYGLLGRVEALLFHAHGRAYQLLYWRDTHRHCGRCGSLTRAIEDGRAVLCDSCSLQGLSARIALCHCAGE